MLPERRCVGCMVRKPKNELLRVVRLPSGEVTLDKSGKSDGRGAYICKSSNCVQTVIRKKKLKFHLKTEISESFISQLQEYITSLE